MRILSVIAFGALLVVAPVFSGELVRSEFRYETSGDALILEYRLESSFPYLGEPPFGLRIYGDGRAVASLPEHFPRRAIKNRGLVISRRGDFETRLTTSEIDQILTDIESALLLDIPSLKRVCADQHPGRGRTDSATTHLTVNLTDYRPVEETIWQGPVRQQILWEDVFGDAQLRPELSELQALREADKALPKWAYAIAQQVEAAEQLR